MTEIEIALERLAEIARDHYIRDPQSTRDAMADIEIIRDALKRKESKK